MAISLLMLARRGETAQFADARYGYGTQTNGQRALSAGLSLAIVGGIGSALVLALAAPAIIEAVGPETMTVRPINDPPPPIEQVLIEDPLPAARQDFTTPPLDTPIPPVGDGPVVPFIDTTTILPPGPLPGTGEGMGTGPTIPEEIITPPRPPVFIDAIRDRRYSSAFQPPYPASAEREGVEGTVRVRVRIGTNGRVIAVENLGATDERFFAATERQALRSWRFRAATRGGVPVETTLELTVTFRMPQED
jgi:periplasmic protein TonB